MVLSSNINAFVMESEPVSLHINTPSEIICHVGEEFDKNSIDVKAEFSDGSRRKVTDYTVSGFDSGKNDVQKVTILYYGISKSIDVNVKSDAFCLLEKALESVIMGISEKER